MVFQFSHTTWHMCEKVPNFIPKNTMIYGYIRVSSDKQTVENQRFEIERFCQQQHLNIDGWIEETISGTKDYNERALGRLLKRVQKEDIIICSELSRLGRSVYMIMEILGYCMSHDCRVWTIKEGYRLGDDIQSKVLAFAFGLSAEIERNLISQRTKEALARLRAEGKHVGRPFGSLTSQELHRLARHDAYIREALQEGVRPAEIIRRLHTNRSSLRRYMRRYILPKSERRTGTPS